MDDIAARRSLAERLRAEAPRAWRDRVRPFLSGAWRRRWVRWLAYAGAAFLALLTVAWLVFARNLPSAAALASYEPPLPTMVRDAYGEPIHSFARERRVQLEYNDFPPDLVHAFLAAEDKNFFTHGGIDYLGILSAAIDNLSRTGRSRGASTITQQVAKNILLSNEYSYTRKIKEAILARRIESALSKPQILQLYLNEIPLGRQSFGVQAAAQAYFNKDVDQLTIPEEAFLASLPKAPEKYGRPQFAGEAIARRNWVLSEMARNGWITPAQAADAAAQPLGLIARASDVKFERVGGYFIEELRRQLIDRFGENKQDGPYSVYAGGLWVRSSLEPRYQALATKALRDGLLRYQAGRAWSKPLARIDVSGNWQARLDATNMGIDYRDWRIAVALSQGNPARIGFPGGQTAQLSSPPAGLKAGDIIAVAPAGAGSYAIRVVPEVGGGMVVENPYNGRVFAMQGGFDSRLSSFNRATQAGRQPGSTIKPFVYATALDNGMTPASIVVDAPFCIYQSSILGTHCFRNFANERGAGAQTMRWGLEQSRNLMTVRIANDIGMDKVVRTFKRMGIGDYQPFLSMALGAGDTTVARMTNAYSMLVNHGRRLTPTLIDFAQDRHGKVVWPRNWQPCQGCNMPDWDGRPMPRFVSRAPQQMDPVTAYQVVHMLEGVVQRGTAVVLRDMNRPLFGKTGTTNGPTNVWFVGGSPQLVAGVYLGYDQPRSLGGYAQGGRIAAPIFKQFALEAMKDMPKLPFTAPAGVRMVRIDRHSGRRVYDVWPSDDPKSPVIWEAFAAETEPKRTIRREEITAAPNPSQPSATSRSQTPGSNPAQERTNEFLQQQGGIY